MAFSSRSISRGAFLGNQRRSLWLICLAFTTGCGAGGYRVSGSVTANGEPIETGAITFRPIVSGSGSQVVQASIDRGAYSIAEPPLRRGAYRIEIQARRKSNRKIRSDGDNKMIDVLEDFIPPEFNVQSKIETEITGDRHDLDFELKF